MNRGRKPMHDQIKAKDFKASFKKLVSYSKKYMPLFYISLVLSMLSSILSIIGPDKLKELTDVITIGLRSNIDLNKVKTIAFNLTILYVLSIIFNYIQGFIMASVTNRFSKQMREEISNKINRLPLSYFDKTSIGDVLSRVTNDVDTISQSVNQSIGYLLGALTMLIGSIFMMFKTNYILAITAIISSLIGFFLMMIILKRSQKYFMSVQNELGNINGHIEEVFSGHSVVKLYNGVEEVENKFDLINKKLLVSAQKSQFYSGLMHPIMSFVGNFGYVSICIIGAVLTMNNTISFGVIIAFMMYVRFFNQPLTQIGQSLSSLQSTAAASERVFEFLDEKELSFEEKGFIKLDSEKAKGNIEFKKVNFGYLKNKKVIKNFSVKIKSGQKVAIVGPTGAGKTTIINLLMKFYEIDSGDILIDNISLKNIKRENVHDLFTMVLQDSWIFEGTIKENIIYNKKNITEEQLEQVCSFVGLDHFIKTLPDGYNSFLGDNDTLSVGQKQLLTIARAMIEEKPFLIFDEATSSVDTRTEGLVQKSMDKLMKNKTSFIIAHRLSTIKNSDLILVMKNGDIVEQGNHDELIKLNGYYNELYNSQFQSID